MSTSHGFFGPYGKEPQHIGALRYQLSVKIEAIIASLCFELDEYSIYPDEYARMLDIHSVEYCLSLDLSDLTDIVLRDWEYLVQLGRKTGYETWSMPFPDAVIEHMSTRELNRILI